MIEEALKEAEGVLERNREGGNADELRGAFEKLQASAHKLAEAMYKQAGGADGGGGGGGAAAAVARRPRTTTSSTPSSKTSTEQARLRRHPDPGR